MTKLYSWDKVVKWSGYWIRDKYIVCTLNYSTQRNDKGQVQLYDFACIHLILCSTVIYKNIKLQYYTVQSATIILLYKQGILWK